MKLATLIISLIIGINCAGQNYTRDAGLRLGTLPGFTYRQNLGEVEAIEAQTLFGKEGLRFRVLKQFFKPALLSLSDNIYFCYGYGAHIGISRYSSYRYLTKNYLLDRKTFGPLIGLDAYLGLEYNIREYPIIIGINVIPFFEFSTHRFFYIFMDDTSISIKYKF